MEDDDWHEDTYEWREKEQAKKQANVRFDPNDPSSMTSFAESQGASGMQVRKHGDGSRVLRRAQRRRVQMAFAKLKTISDKKEAEELADRPAPSASADPT